MPLKNKLTRYLKLTTFFSACLIHFLQAQSPVVYVPHADDSVSLSASVSMLSARLKTEKDGLQDDNKKYTAEIYEKRFNSLKELFDKKEILTDPKAQLYLQAIGNEIIKNNSGLQGLPVSFYFSKTAVPNAATWGEGVILFNTGLFDKLDNESQVAFVLCHELAHLYLKHGDKAINQYVDNIYNRGTQRELRQIKNSEYNKRQRFEGVVKDISFDGSKHSRDHENEADSVGLVFMHNTQFDVSQAVTCMALLDTIDNDNFDAAGFIKKTYNCREYPFKDKWLRRDDGLLGGFAQAEEQDTATQDSLKTHPDCKQREERLVELTAKLSQPNEKKYVVSKEQFEHFKNVFPYETVSFYYNAKQYSRCLFYAFELLQKDSANPWLNTITGGAFNAIYDAQKSHTLGNVVNMPAPAYAENYNILLQFIQNLYLDEVAGVNYYFLKHRRQQMTSFPPFEPVFIACAKHMAP